ncbi:MAG: hypothetical protein LBP59_08395 [Planctomycetaceae bacterium]|nr:hypothetical protein [Planctomycetaceae bacterium]
MASLNTYRELLKTTNLFLLTTENTEEIFNWNQNVIEYYKLFALEFSFTFACLDFGRQAWTLLNR